MLSTLSQDFGYFPNTKKSWLIAKSHKKKEIVKEIFKETAISFREYEDKTISQKTGKCCRIKW